MQWPAPVKTALDFLKMNESEQAWAILTEREKAWVLLSDLFVDTTYTENELARIASALGALKFSVEEFSYILKKEVSPVAGRWMCRPGAIGPWPMFDWEDIKTKIHENLRREWYKKQRRCLIAMIATWRSWKTVKSYIRKQRHEI